MRVTMVDAGATTVSTGYRVTDYKTCVLSILGSTNANLKVFVKGAISTGTELDTAPSFTILSSQREGTKNAWDFIDVVDLQDNASIDGDTGINLSGNRTRLVEVNTNYLDWLAVHATGIVAGTVTIVGAFISNE